MSLDLSRIKALCFDVDGTLSDTDDLYAQKVSRFFPRFLFKDPDHTARRFVMWIEAPGNALLGLADTLGLDDEMAVLPGFQRGGSVELQHFRRCRLADTGQAASDHEKKGKSKR